MVFGLVLWYYTKNPLTALMITILLDFVGNLLILHKTWRAPYTESIVSILFFTLSAVLGALSVGAINQKAIFPVYVMLANISVLVLIYIRRQWRARQIRDGISRKKKKPVKK